MRNKVNKISQVSLAPLVKNEKQMGKNAPARHRTLCKRYSL